MLILAADFETIVSYILEIAFCILFIFGTIRFFIWNAHIEKQLDDFYDDWLAEDRIRQNRFNDFIDNYGDRFLGNLTAMKRAFYEEETKRKKERLNK